MLRHLDRPASRWDGPPRPSPGPVPPGTDPAAAWLAREQGVSYEEAGRRIERQGRMEPVIDEVGAALGDRFAGARVDDGGGRLVVAATGDLADVRAPVEAVAARHGLGGFVTVVPAPRGEAELERVLAAVQERLLERWRADPDAVPANYVLGLDARTGRVRLAAPPRGPYCTPRQESFLREVVAPYGDAVDLEIPPVMPAERVAAIPWPVARVEAGGTRLIVYFEGVEDRPPGHPCRVAYEGTAEVGPDAVRVTVTGRDVPVPNVMCTAAAWFWWLAFDLPAPLAGRPVLDGLAGERRPVVDAGG